MLNPSLSNFRIEFSDDFFPKEITMKYDEFLFHKNSPFKLIKTQIYESIQQLTLPGISINTVSATGLENLGLNPRSSNSFPETTVNRQYPGTDPLNNVIDSTVVTISFRNSIINWMYIYEVFYSYYKRKRSITDFQIILIMMDSAEIPMIRFKLSDCFVSTLPGLDFAFNASFNESKTFDAGFTFNKFDVDFLIPGFNLTKMNL